MSKPMSNLRKLTSALCAATVLPALCIAQTYVYVDNFSFESPVTPSQETQIDLWSKTSQPSWYNPDSNGGLAWDQLNGVFANPPVGNPNHISNVGGNQALYSSSIPEAGIFQVLDAKYESGLSYALAAGINGRGLVEGSQLLFIFYFESITGRVDIGSGIITYTPELFGDGSQLVPLVGATTRVFSPLDGTVGKNIGVIIRSYSGSADGQWVIDNVRVFGSPTVVPEPTSLVLGVVGVLSLLGLRSRIW